jgi:Uma2 family endonuclease
VQISDAHPPFSRAKIQRYLDAGVLLVWAVDPKKQIVEVYRSGAETAEVLRKGDVLSGEEVIPKFEIVVADLFEIN